MKQFFTFLKANLTALAATIVDFLILYVFVEFAQINYVPATTLAAFLGALTNFSLNRTWTFRDQKGSMSNQGVRYTLTAAGSLILNTLFVFLFTELIHLRYLQSKVVAAILIGWGWNYPLHRLFVFERPKQNDSNKF